MRALLVLWLLSLGSSYAQDLDVFKERVNTLSSEYMGGRGYVDRKDSLAAVYLRDEFKTIGLLSIDSTYWQPFPMTVNTFPQNIDLQIDEQPMTLGDDYILDASSGSGTGRYKAFYAETFEAKQIITEGRHYNQVVLIPDSIITRWRKENDPVMRDIIRCKAMFIIKEHKLTASLAWRNFPIPVFHLKQGDYKDVKHVTFHVHNEIWKGRSQNVIGLLEGEKKDSTIIISGHYDHLGKMGDIYFPGANDNASGVAMMLSLAEYFKAHQDQLKYNLAFIAFGGEEAGLIGSKYYIGNPMFPLEQTKAQITLDLFGAGSEGITVVNAPNNLELYNTLNEVNSDTLLPQIKSRSQSANSDHYYFAEAGIPSIFLYTMGDLTAYHDVEDTPEKLEYDMYDEVFELLRRYILALQE